MSLNSMHPAAQHGNQFEQINTLVYDRPTDGSQFIADKIASLITEKASRGEMAVLGLATGSSPIEVYRMLVHKHRHEGLSFRNVITFNLDEYYPMPPDALQSYVRFMHQHLFDHIDILPQNIHIPDGTLPMEEVRAYTERYDAAISAAGGIDLQLLGIGRTGHIGFNEPGSALNSRTRLVRLDKITCRDAASDFFGEENVPARAITMGVGSIMEARQVYIMAWGEGKAPIVRETVEGSIRDTIPATYLQRHPHCTMVLDSAAASELTRMKAPWLVMECDWTDQLTKRAAIWLSNKTGKALLKLTNEDYNEHGMGDLLAQHGDAERINLLVFNQLQRTITGWPGGKPNADDSTRPERATPYPKRVLIFSPHPDDDVISMGGTLLRLVDQGHEVHVAYQTSGNIAVFDDEVIRFLDFARDSIKHEGAAKQMAHELDQVREYIKNKKAGEVDKPEVLHYKGLIRKGEALAACRYCEIAEANAHFLNLPFYETGTIKKKPHTKADVDMVKALLETIKPHQIYAAGDLTDPHGTHRVCLSIILEALGELKSTTAWLSDTYVWLYRGAWQEWDISEIEMAVPIGPKDMRRKLNAIFKHQSQKDRAMYPGNDEREFWERAKQRNQDTAIRYNALGMPEYEAIEGFVRWRG